MTAGVAPRLPAGPPVIGIDIGGTLIKVIVVDARGTVRWRARGPTPAGDGLVSQVVRLTTSLNREATVAGAPARCAGVVVPGLVDAAAGVARYASNLPWLDLPLQRLLEDDLGLPVAVGHDVRAAGLAEGRLGAARGVADFLFVGVGTGISAAVSLDGHIRPGAHHLAGELGHIVVEPGGDLCGCGARGCLETVSGAAAIARRYAGRGGVTVTGSAEVFALAAAGDRIAVEVRDEAVGALATVLAGIQSGLDVELIVIGGGVAGAGRQLLEPTTAALAARLTFQRLPHMALAELGDEAGCLGAALLGRSAAFGKGRERLAASPLTTGEL